MWKQGLAEPSMREDLANRCPAFRIHDKDIRDEIARFCKHVRQEMTSYSQAANLPESTKAARSPEPVSLLS